MCVPLLLSPVSDLYILETLKEKVAGPHRLSILECHIYSHNIEKEAHRNIGLVHKPLNQPSFAHQPLQYPG